jgi:hypothetical protein
MTLIATFEAFEALEAFEVKDKGSGIDGILSMQQNKWPFENKRGS